MKAGSKTYMFLGIAAGFVSVVNLANLLSGRGNPIDVLVLVVFTILSAEGFVSYLRIKGKTESHLIS